MNNLLQAICQKDMTQPLSTITLYGYDTQDNQASVTDPKGNITQYRFDDYGRKNQTTSPDTLTTKYQYDGAGNPTQKVDAKGTIVNYTYDALNRITTIQFPSDPNQNITLSYDSVAVKNGIGRLTGMIDPSGTYVFHYDAHGNLTKEEKNVLGVNYITQYAYDKNNILSTITYPYPSGSSGRTVTFIRDAVRRISRVDTVPAPGGQPLASNIQYLPYGGITGMTYGNGLSLSQGYDTQYRMTSIAAGQVLNLTYSYDPNGNVISVVDGVNTAPGPGVEPFEVYSYLQGTNKLTHIETTPPIDFGYDLNANITSETGWTYVYDLSNQPYRIYQGTNLVAEYVHNGAGQRIKKVAGGTTRIFHYDLWGHMIAETDQSGQMISEYVYLGDQLLAMIKPGNLAYYFHNDHLGTPQVLTDGTGNVAWKALYTPFGEVAITIEAVQNPFRLPGQYYDQETGLHYNYFRHYNPPTGRYLTPDPIGLAGGVNLFTYAKNNPGRFIDRFGKIAVADDIAVAALAAGVYVWAVAYVNSPEGQKLVRDIARGLEWIWDISFASKPGSKPNDCPTGTKPINRYPELTKDDIHKIKKGVGAGPKDWVGITPEGDVITGDSSGKAVNQGPFKDYLP